MIIPKGWRELSPGEIIHCDDKIWQSNIGPWEFVGGSVVGTRYLRKTVELSEHWKIIRETAATGGTSK